MKSSVSRISSRFGIVIPKTIRESLGLKSGDFMQYITKGRKAQIKRVNAGDHPFSTFDEWASEADEASYRSL